MRLMDICAGIGGFSLAAHWLGWETVQFIEIDGKCQEVLKKNFPNVPIHGDLFTFKGYEGQADIITAGFPCQPFSTAGKRQGEKDDRFIFSEVLRVISEVRPTWVVLENVTGLVSMEDGKTLEKILSQVEGKGYEVQSYLIPACGVGAWHRRERIWIVAHSNKSNDRRKPGEFQRAERKERISERNGVEQPTTTGEIRGGKVSTNSDKERSQWRQEARNSKERRKKKQSERCGKRDTPTRQIPQSEFCRVNDGIPPTVDKLGKANSERLKQLGNAIVPQVAYQILKVIDDTKNKT